MSGELIPVIGAIVLLVQNAVINAAEKTGEVGCYGTGFEGFIGHEIKMLWK
jgi:hypothetical protein